MTTRFHRLRLAAATALLVGFATFMGAAVAAAQTSPTPEGTVITNTAHATYTDANNNTYAPVQASVNVTVGFKAGIDVTAAAATLYPQSPSINNTMTFTLTNTGNGTDQMVLSPTNTDPTVITNIRYVYDGVTYTTIGDLNAKLATVDVAAGANISVAVLYDVPVAQGGKTTTFTLTDHSNRDATVFDADHTQIAPPIAGTILVTPDGDQNLLQLPSNTTTYTFTFHLLNNENQADLFDLVASSPGSDVITIVSVNGVTGTTATTASVPAGGEITIDVVYTVAEVAAGSKDTLVLLATSKSQPSTVHDDGFADLTVIRPLLAISKAAYRADQTSLINGGKVLPGETIWYKVTVQNSGTAPATSVSVSDNLPAQLTLVGTEEDVAGWTFHVSANSVTADLSGTLAAGASRFFWVSATVN